MTTEDWGRYASAGAYARDLDPSTAHRYGRDTIRGEVAVSWDGGDPWGSCLSNLGGICDVLWFVAGSIPGSVGYSPGAGGPDFDSYPSSMFLELFDEGYADVADFEYWARVLDVYADRVPEDRRY